MGGGARAPGAPPGWAPLKIGKKKEKIKKISGAKIDFLPFLKMQIMCFCTFEIALFSNFGALIYISQFLLVPDQDSSQQMSKTD